MPNASNASACVLLTGATGFLGKVVLHQLLRERTKRKINTIYVLVRPKRGQTPEARFAETKASPCFASLPDGWDRHVEVVAGNLSAERCGMSSDAYHVIARRVSHIVHCAASVDFDLPLQQACDANIVGSLNVLELAKKCGRLKRMVSVSTAYVTPHRTGPLHEELAPLPRPAAELYSEALAGTIKKEEILAETGHPNTYTLTKCIAEHLLMERSEAVPLRIVRPSIISAAWQQPRPGWIDSSAALAGFVSAIGAGYLHVVVGDWTTHLDVVPVDEVSNRVVDQAFAPNDAAHKNPVSYAVAGVEKAYSIRKWVNTIEDFFARYPGARRAKLRYLGPRNWQYETRRLLHHQLPASVAARVYRLRGNKIMERQAKRLVQKLDMINGVFPYFTQKTFDFRASAPLPASFDIDAYVSDICEGVARHLMGKKPNEVVLGGSRHRAPISDMLWSLAAPRGNMAIRLSAATLSKALRRIFDHVTFDQRSFERAAALAGPDGNVVVIPTHRSYMDFLVCSYLFFARPNLGIKIPHIAAAQEFSEVSGVGWLFKQMQAFYIRRGLGKADPAVTRAVHELVLNREILQFFIEGERSRARQFLQPRRGLLRSLQATGRKFVVLPVAISYDRVPEELTFLRELKGYPKDAMALQNLARWTLRMVRGRIKLGRLHVACGEPLEFAPDADVHQFSHDVMARLQQSTVSTTFHLRYFVNAHPRLGLDVAWMRQAIERRGGTVLDSDTPTADTALLDSTLERTLRHQWQHLFLPEAAARQPDNAALAHYRLENAFAPVAADSGDADDERLQTLLYHLFEPVCSDYAAVARTMARHAGTKRTFARRDLLAETAYRDYNTAQSAIRALQAEGLVESAEGRALRIVGAAADFEAFAATCVWCPAQVMAEASWAKAVNA